MKHHLTARPCPGEDYEFVYDLKKQCYHDYVAAIWGWEEEKQRELFAAYWEKAAPGLFILLLDGVPVGFLDGHNKQPVPPAGTAGKGPGKQGAEGPAGQGTRGQGGPSGLQEQPGPAAL